jgi:hypothetical protein
MALKTPDAPATKSQTFYIFKLKGGDVRGQNLTMQQANDMIERLLADKAANTEAKKAEPKSKPVRGNSNYHPFALALEEATLAANKAGDEWMKNAKPMYRVFERANPMDDTSPIVRDYGTMLDVCGIVYLRIEDKRCAFAKWYMEQKKNKYRGVYIQHKYRGRQEMGLREACDGAALEVLNKHGVKGVELYSRID